MKAAKTITTQGLHDRYGDGAIMVLFAKAEHPYISPSTTPQLWRIERKLPTVERFKEMLARELSGVTGRENCKLVPSTAGTGMVVDGDGVAVGKYRS